ncbi:MAG: histidine kinase [Deltaproteobacteria bacterium HGW-Deltaproteobacteria-14]|jgi:signal transduction histidine kinase|nr:MAG: histidine kinase [Deltaproteobacteria bacterium HGW-Deltaproteobacteria-14]
MKRRRRATASFLFSLRGRLLFLICLAVLPAVLFAFFVAESERSATLERTEQDALHLAELAGREHAHQIRGASELLSWLGAKVARDGPSSPVITDPSFLRALLAGHPQLANIGVLSPDGRVLASAYPLASYRSWSDNPAYLDALRSDGAVAGRYLISPIFERPTLNHAYAVRDAHHDVIAVLFSGLDLSWLSEVSRHSDLPDGSSLLVTDRDGRVLARSDAAQPLAVGTEDADIADVSALARSQHGRTLTLQGTGVRRFFVATPLDATGLFVLVGMPYDSVLAKVNGTFYRALIGLGALLLFTVAAVFIAAELGVLRGVRSLARAAQRLGAGDLAARATVPRGQGEFSSLATAFNTMADSLAARHREALDAQARLRALAGRLQVVREAEAARISRELHDEIGQVLTSLKIDLSRLPLHCASSQAREPDATALKAEIAAMSRQIDAAVDFVRHISSGLRPGVLDKLGLTAALEWQARETEARTELVVEVEADAVDSRLDERVSVTLFRIAQEALTNVIRHADARVVEIELTATDATMTLAVRDDGEGITADAVESNESVGLIGMRERAMLIDGELTIRGVPGRGTAVSVTVPIHPTPEVADAHSDR